MTNEQHTYKNICVYAAASDMAPDKYKEAAYETGKLIAHLDYGVITGAGKVGLMRSVADGALDNGGVVTGVIPQFMVAGDLQYDRLTRVIVTQTMHERKQWMADNACAAIAMPGGYGTLDELAEIIAWRQLRLWQHPVFILNIEGFYDNLLAWFKHAISEQVISEQHANLWTEVTTYKQLQEQLTAL